MATPASAKSASSQPRSRTRGTKPDAAKGVVPGSFRAKVRMYRHGLGDCFLVTLPRANGSSFYIVIDCGVIQGTPNAQETMTEVVADIAKTTNGRIDLLVATHQHWDHLSGFVQAREGWQRLTVGQVWLAWTEDPADDLARQLVEERDKAVRRLSLAADRMRMAGDSEGADLTGSLLEFFGAAGGTSVKDALDVVRSLPASHAPPRYCKPEDAPVDLGDPPARLYVLGPPRDEKLIKQTGPSARNPETYGLVAESFWSNVDPGLGEVSVSPFGTLYAIPNQVAQKMSLFKLYWATEPWRRIDSAWLGDAAEFALQLDSATNNTSLVLAIELAGGDVLLFPGDAQVGSWLSWQDLKWPVGSRTVTGPDLLQRTIFYKVGHHGSFNATLKEKGLELMSQLELAMVPVNHQMALEKHWGGIPLPALLDALREKTNGALLQADSDAPPGLVHLQTATPLYFEVVL